MPGEPFFGMSEAEETHRQTAENHYDGTHTYHYFSLNAGYIRLDRLTIIEAFNLTKELDDVGDDWGPVLVKWADGYRDASLHGLYAANWEAALAQEVLRRWPPN
jgi:hypothetical protein